MKDYTKTSMWYKTQTDYRTIDGRFTIRFCEAGPDKWEIHDHLTGETKCALSFMGCITIAQSMATRTYELPIAQKN